MIARSPPRDRALQMYRLVQLAPGSYDLELDGELIGSVVRSGYDADSIKWHAELLRPDVVRPAPFSEAEHEFRTLDDVIRWLGGAEVVHSTQRRA